MSQPAEVKDDLTALDEFEGLVLADVTPKLEKWWFQDRSLLKLNLLLLCAFLAQFTCGFDGSMLNGMQSLPSWKVAFGNPVRSAKCLGSSTRLLKPSTGRCQAGHYGQCYQHWCTSFRNLLLPDVRDPRTKETYHNRHSFNYYWLCSSGWCAKLGHVHRWPHYHRFGYRHRGCRRSPADDGGRVSNPSWKDCFSIYDPVGCGGSHYSPN